MFTAIDTIPTREQLVYRRLRQAIIDGTLQPGQEVVVARVAAQLGVSRIPVMQACKRLVGEGFLVSNPWRSATVVSLTEERILEGKEVLLALECLALEHAVRHLTEDDLAHCTELNRAVRDFRPQPGSLTPNTADQDFHAALWRAARKPYLEQQIRLVYDQNEPARALGRRSRDPARSAGEHEAILEALRRRDLGRAQAALRRHRDRGTEVEVEVLRQLRQEASSAGSQPQDSSGAAPGDSEP
ncbi:MAG TPA: GntR family transcriptional regulator [Chloroflexota bacterium]|nr:GntR family transcriptional regulator [Chloroflexota bacterium]